MSLIYKVPKVPKSLIYKILYTANTSPDNGSKVLTQNRANTLECARTRNDRQNDQYSENPRRTSLTGFADRSDRCKQGARGDLEQRAREGPRRSS